MPKVRGKGHIDPLEDKPRNKCRRWKLRVSVGKDLATGKYPPRCRNVRGTYTDAQRAMREFIAEIEADVVVPKGDTNFAEYAKDWLKKRRDAVAHGTYRKNKDHLECLLLHLKGAKLGEITPAAIENMYADLMSGKSPSGRRLSGTYVACVGGTLSVILNAARRDGHISTNPCELAKRPSNDTKERKALPFKDMKDLISKLDPRDASELACLVMLKAGARRGESVAIHPRNVDRENMILHIDGSIDNTGTLKVTKTKKGTRDLPLTQSLLDDIDARIEYMEEEGLPTGPNDPIVCNEIGLYLLPNSVTRWWARNRKKLGYENWTLYELRHSYLSELARRKVPPKVLQEIAGHESFSTTNKIYLHVSMEDKRNALQVVDW